MTAETPGRRAPASLKVRTKCQTLEQFTRQLSGDTAYDGVFLKTSRPLPAGTLVRLELQLQSGEPVVHGVGRVDWRRTKPVQDLPPGMGVAFLKLDALSRTRVARMVAQRGPAISRFEDSEGAELAPPLQETPSLVAGVTSRPPPQPPAAGATGPGPAGLFSAGRRPQAAMVDGLHARPSGRRSELGVGHGGGGAETTVRGSFGPGGETATGTGSQAGAGGGREHPITVRPPPPARSDPGGGPWQDSEVTAAAPLPASRRATASSGEGSPGSTASDRDLADTARVPLASLRSAPSEGELQQRQAVLSADIDDAFSSVLRPASSFPPPAPPAASAKPPAVGSARRPESRVPTTADAQASNAPVVPTIRPSSPDRAAARRERPARQGPPFDRTHVGLGLPDHGAVDVPTPHPSPAFGASPSEPPQGPTASQPGSPGEYQFDDPGTWPGAGVGMSPPPQPLDGPNRDPSFDPDFESDVVAAAPHERPDDGSWEPYGEAELPEEVADVDTAGVLAAEPPALQLTESDDLHMPSERDRRRGQWLIAGAMAVLAALGGYWWWQTQRVPTPSEPAPGGSDARTAPGAAEPGPPQGADAPAPPAGPDPAANAAAAANAPGPATADPVPNTGSGPAAAVTPSAEGSDPGQTVSVRVVASPRGSQVFVDGQLRGETPATIDVPRGRPIDLTVRATGHAAASRSVVIEGESGTERFRLERLPFVLKVQTTPKAEVSVRGQTHLSPAEIDLGYLDVPVSVSAVRPGYRRTSRPVRPGDFKQHGGRLVHRLRIGLQPLPGAAASALRDQTWPAGAQPTTESVTRAASPPAPASAPVPPDSPEPSAPVAPPATVPSPDGPAIPVPTGSDAPPAG